jgi:hypothetical protein
VETGDESIASEFDRHCHTLVSEEQEEGWQAEIRWYLKDLPADVTKDTDIVAWWQVRDSSIPGLNLLLITLRIMAPISQLFDALP